MPIKGLRVALSWSPKILTSPERVLQLRISIFFPVLKPLENEILPLWNHSKAMIIDCLHRSRDSGAALEMSDCEEDVAEPARSDGRVRRDSVECNEIAL
jgi:hypothetical protein